ncbi:MAG: hypothetical protein ACK5Q5_17745 [Planctomycetaceae bacterium]
MTAATLAAFDTDLALLGDDATAVAYTLRRQAESLRAESSRSGLHAAQAIRQLRAQVTQLSRIILTGDEHDTDQLPSLSSLQAELNRLRVELPIRKLLAEARRVSGPLTADDQQQLQASMAQLEQRLTQSVAADDERPCEEHPLAALLRLICPGPELSDDEWAADLQTVRAKFGSSLAVAAARGRLTLNETPDESSLPDQSL